MSIKNRSKELDLSGSWRKTFEYSVPRTLRQPAIKRAGADRQNIGRSDLVTTFGSHYSNTESAAINQHEVAV